jgi:hypothetical protein
MELTAVTERETVEKELPDRVTTIRALNEAAESFREEITPIEAKVHDNESLDEQERRTYSDYQVFNNTKRNVIGGDGPIPEDLTTEIWTHEFEDPQDREGPKYKMQEGIVVNGVLDHLRKKIQENKNSGNEERTSYYQRLLDDIEPNTKTFSDIYYPHKTPEQIKAADSFKAREEDEAFVRSQDQFRRSSSQEGDWAGAENDLLNKRIEMTLPHEFEETETVALPKLPETEKTELPKPDKHYIFGLRGKWMLKRKSTDTIPIEGKEPESELVKTLEREKKEGEGSVVTDTEKESERVDTLETETARVEESTESIEEPRIDREMVVEERTRAKVDRLRRTGFASGLKVDIRNRIFGLIAAGIITAAGIMVPHDRIGKITSGPVSGGPTPSGLVYDQPPSPAAPKFEGYKGKGPPIVTANFGEEGHSLEGWALAQGAMMDNEDQVVAAKAIGEDFQPNLAQKERDLGTPLSPDDPDLLQAVEKAQKEVPWWNRFMSLFKGDARQYNIGEDEQSLIKGDQMPANVTVVTPRNQWEVARQEHMMAQNHDEY